MAGICLVFLSRTCKQNGRILGLGYPFYNDKEI